MTHPERSDLPGEEAAQHNYCEANVPNGNVEVEFDGAVDLVAELRDLSLDLWSFASKVEQLEATEAA